jgi:Sep-tRNA:Cys-tRNA synthetase
VQPNYINLHPIQRGGILTEAARNALPEWGDGYSTCDWCPPKTARLDMIHDPPISEFLEDLAQFLNMEVARVVTRCREAKFITFYSLAKPGDYVVVDSLAHYTTYIAAEAAGLKVKEVPHNGYPEYRINPDDYALKIEEVKKETGKPPAMVFLTHVDYLFGNMNEPSRVAKIAHDQGIPFMLNCAYTAGIMPTDGKALGADVIVSSGHKSWAAAAPTGILAVTKELSEKILTRSKIIGDVSKRKFGQKELMLLGCTVMGVPLITLMASFPEVVERTKHWDEEVEKARWFVNELERIEGTKQIGIRPKEHTLMHIETPAFFKVSETHKRGGFFLYDELKSRNIVGIQAGLSKHFKVNTFGLTWDQIKYVAGSFQEIAKKYGVEVR